MNKKRFLPSKSWDLTINPKFLSLLKGKVAQVDMKVDKLLGVSLIID